MRGKLITGVIAAGLLSRMTSTGSIVIDKYAGDALYAVMIYLLLPIRAAGMRALLAMGIMTLIEGFQLTGIPAAMADSTVIPWRWAGRLLGTTFSWIDLLAYAIGIGIIWAWDYRRLHTGKG